MGRTDRLPVCLTVPLHRWNDLPVMAVTIMILAAIGAVIAIIVDAWLSPNDDDEWPPYE